MEMKILSKYECWALKINSERYTGCPHEISPINKPIAVKTMIETRGLRHSVEQLKQFIFFFFPEVL
jgi:hypothetical protein